MQMQKNESSEACVRKGGSTKFETLPDEGISR